ncbi:hypothetical protein [Candidatus Lucifugimonas marina]|uniref:Sec-independent protein translocase protein TatB homolog n=1 Tax=Candidatus Lucifugimonas marina TaxID=3038979 RepID=A0AAJ5ZKH9_9CHLR|nr:hypothetical protein [SAR202 cluster bacterium JH702]MDG0870817.1 hypothetical protein [SAR202 cluster bacterium JH639]WFG36463.1 hypothetical protein GKN94_12495 [SAR202 cluster bacterium JH545]WFG40396.1 hypothetical protein GKO48_12530 [SAR202 cluster bacterium JH1073]
MSFFGLGGLEIVLIGAIALFVLGPKRMLQGIRDGRKIYSDLKRQRDTLQTLITEAIDLEDLKEQIDADGIKDTVKSLEDDFKIDQIADDIRRANAVVDKSIPRDWKFSRPPIQVDPEVRDSIPDLNISGASGADSGESGASGELLAKKSGPPEAAAAPKTSEPLDSEESAEKNDEVKS